MASALSRRRRRDEAGAEHVRAPSRRRKWLAAAVEADIDRGAWVDPAAGQVTVKEWSDRWLEAASAHLKIKTHAGYRSLIKTKINPSLGHLPLSAVKPITISEWISELRRSGFSPSRIRQSYRVLSQIMRSAVENELIISSPCRGVRLPRMPQTEPHILTEAQADLVISHAVSPHDLLVMLLAYAGLRIGEAFALRRRSFDLDAGTVIISESLVEIQGQLSFDTPKNHQKRTVQLPDFVVARARELIPGSDVEPTTLLFPTGSGVPQHLNAWRRTYFDPAVKAAGLKDVTPHDLRASHATWVAARHGVMAAAARLGHAHASVTTRHYARTVTGQDKLVADEIGRERESRSADDSDVPVEVHAEDEIQPHGD
jgi:integrase